MQLQAMDTHGGEATWAGGPSCQGGLASPPHSPRCCLRPLEGRIPAHLLLTWVAGVNCLFHKKEAEAQR